MDESFFQLILAGILLIFFALWGYQLILSGLRFDSFYSPIEIWVVAVILRISLLIGFFGIILFLYNDQLMKWSQFMLPSWVRLLGTPLGLFALFILYFSFRNLGQNYSATLRIRKNHSLTTSGPYRIIRHPMYVAFFLLWASYFLLSSNWFIGLSGGVAYGLIYWDRIPKEEQMLINKFGTAYIMYISKTGKIFPKIKKVIK